MQFTLNVERIDGEIFASFTAKEIDGKRRILWPIGDGLYDYDKEPE